MKSITIIIFVINAMLLSSQKIVWESEYKLEKPVMTSFCQVIKDKENNYVSIFRDVFDPVIVVNFIKYNNYGVLIKYDSVMKDFSISVDCFYETDKGYRVFCGVNRNTMTTYSNRLPYIIDFTSDASILKESCPYDLKDNTILPENSYTLKLDKSNVINIEESFYIAFDKSMVKISENSQKPGAHIIISKYNGEGKIVWRKGYDTLLQTSKTDMYYVREITKTIEGNLLIVFDNYLNGTNGRKNTSIIIMEVDTNGNKIKEYSYEHDERQIESDCIVALPNGGYIVKCHFYDNYNDEFYWKTDKEGKIIKKAIIPQHQNSNFPYHTDRMKLTPDGGVLLFGKHTFHNLDKLEFDSLRFYMIKLNSELEVVWEYEWYDCIYQNMSMIRDVLFLDNENMIVTGCKDRYKFYIAHINLSKTDVKEVPENKVKVSVHPQPFRDICEITIANAGGQHLNVNIYDALGKMVMKLCSETAQSDRKSFLVNGRSLAPGAYFVEVKAGKEVFREKIIRTE